MLNQLKEFYKKNRLFIIIGLAFILLMQICSRGGRVSKQAVPETSVHQPDSSVSDDSQLKPLREIYYEEQQNKKTRNPEITNLFILMGLVLLVYVATRRGWLQKLAPSIVWVNIRIRRHKSSKDRIATITISNHTKESLTFSSPVLSFGSPLKKSRKFKLKGGGDQSVFPLTLMPGTAHSLNINLDAFRQKAGITKGYKWVKTEVDTGTKSYCSIWKYLF
ncbi:hypothetical protein KEM09_01505 [Carboxylicivirga mesophila]|uniref:Uncharacterized protein n=1 Tax=Carboxylicivirga mesophila TaxID=1166478 RepID=A0ABS5K536_9BACT|nr:hypothetical protein [Carboxylicivirga mesophila]MBS2210057.1 hypothetical protein [Carboxylicivirga mesophila]